MFGHQDNNQQNNNVGTDNNPMPTNNQPGAQDNQTPPDDAQSSVMPTIASEQVSSISPATTPNNNLNNVLSPAGGFPQAPAQKMQSDDGEGSINDIVSQPTPNEDLLHIKTQALDELMPLIDDLDQTPEEKFRTIMMMIQASDNQSLIQSAYETAHKIGDEKAKAQALLDIVNEINYFTHQPVTDN